MYLLILFSTFSLLITHFVASQHLDEEAFKMLASTFRQGITRSQLTQKFIQRPIMAQAANDAWKQAGYELEWVNQVQAAKPKKGT